MELSMCSVVGLLGNDTMKVTDKIKGEEVVVLIDSRASHNFISSEAVERLKLSTEKTQTYEVSMRDGYQIKGDKLCNGVELKYKACGSDKHFILLN